MRSFNSEVDAATSASTSRTDKKSVNTKSNSFLNFLIGLSVVMLLSFVMIELQTPVRESTFTMGISDDFEMESNMDVFKIEIPTPEPKPQEKLVAKATPQEKVSQQKPPIVVDNDAPDPDIDIEPASTPVEKSTITSTEPATQKTNNTVNANPSFNMLTVSEVPLYPGCSSKLSSAERIDCLNQKMARFVQRHFDTGLASEVDGKDIITITVLFTIGVDGVAKDIQVRAPIKKLEDEALRTIGKLPKMIPGKFNGAEVNTTYALPIRFKVQ